ncbi:hypothetical protein [Azospirillum palustre]
MRGAAGSPPSFQLHRRGSTRIGEIVARSVLKQFVIFPGNLRNSVLLAGRT